METTVGLSAVISSLNALDAFSEAQRIQFESAMDICYRWLYLQIRRAEQFHRDKYDAETVFCKSTDGIALFYKPNVAWKEVVSNYPDVKLVIYPSGSEWRIQTAPASKEDIFSMRCPAPEHWRGLRDVDIDGVHLVFCHKGGFIGGAITDDEALNIAFKWIELAK